MIGSRYQPAGCYDDSREMMNCKLIAYVAACAGLDEAVPALDDIDSLIGAVTGLHLGHSGADPVFQLNEHMSIREELRLEISQIVQKIGHVSMFTPRPITLLTWVRRSYDWTYTDFHTRQPVRNWVNRTSDERWDLFRRRDAEVETPKREPLGVILGLSPADTRPKLEETRRSEPSECAGSEESCVPSATGDKDHVRTEASGDARDRDSGVFHGECSSAKQDVPADANSGLGDVQQSASVLSSFWACLTVICSKICSTSI